MSAGDRRRRPAHDGSRTSTGGTPVAVDVTADHQARRTWVVLLGGPVVWFGHFMVVYLVAEAGCTGDGPGLDLFDPPVPVVTTAAATVVAAFACLAVAVWAWRRWRAAAPDDPHAASDVAAPDPGEPTTHDAGGALSRIALLLAVLSLVAVLFVGVPALWLGPC